MSHTPTKKVLLVITKSVWGGAQRYVHDLTLGLPKDRYTVTVALGGEGPLKEKLVQERIRVVSIPGLQRDVSLLKEFRVFFFLWNFMRTEDFDIVHLNSSKIGGLGVVAARLARIPRIIFTSHGFAFNEDRPWAIKTFLKFLYWFMMACTSHTIAVSRIMATRVEHWPFIKRKTSVVYNAIATPPFRSRDDARTALVHFSPALGAWLQSNPTGILIGTIAELHPVKGHLYSIQAMTSVPNAALVIVGGGTEHDRLEKLVRYLSLEDRVFLLGARDVAAQYIYAFDIFILISLSEAFSYTLIEAAYAERPVVATEVGGIPEIIEHEKTGILVPPRNAERISAAINRLISDQSLRTLLAHNLHEKATHDFTIEHMLQETITVYESPSA